MDSILAPVLLIILALINPILLWLTILGFLLFVIITSLIHSLGEDPVTEKDKYGYPIGHPKYRGEKHSNS